MMSSEPYKVWNQSRQLKHGLVAKSLSDLIAKGRKKFGWDESEPVRVVLEIDGTEVCDQDYFSCLPKNTTFMMLQTGQLWKKQDKSRPVGVDDDTVDGPAAGHRSSRKNREIVDVIADVIGNPTEILTLTPEQMQAVVAADTSEVTRDLDPDSVEEAKDWIQRYQDNCENIRETKDLLQLLQQAYQVKT